MLFGGFAIVAIILLALIFLRAPPEISRTSGSAGQDPRPGGSVIGLKPNVMMGLLMLAVFCCCVPMSMPMQHVVAFCGDLGFGHSHGAAMLSVLLGSAFLSRMLWGSLADRVGGLPTLLWSSLAQLTALSGFLVTRNEPVLFFVAAAFGLGMAGLLPAYVITVREFYPAKEANWRVPTVLFSGFLGMAAGGWGAAVLYDWFGNYLPAFGSGVAFNVVNFLVLLSLILRHRAFAQRPVLV
jgi:MFS family permease